MNENSQHTIDRRVIERYTDQPARLPTDVRVAIEDAWNGRPVQLYALVDLDAGMRLQEAWLALGPAEIAVATRHGGDWAVHSFPRSRVEAIRETPGLSGSTLVFLGRPDEPALGIVRYTHRQRRAVENVRFVLAQELEGRTVPVSDGTGCRSVSASWPRHSLRPSASCRPTWPGT